MSTIGMVSWYPQASDDEWLVTSDGQADSVDGDLYGSSER